MLSLRVDGHPSEPLGPGWLPGAMRDLTALGSAPVLLVFVLGVAGALAARRQYHALGLLLVASAGGILLNDLLKGLFARPRPGLALRLTDVRSLSFPSGHAMLSAIIYLMLSALPARLVQPRALKLYFVGFAFLLTFVVGVSRVYLGVHYPATSSPAGWPAWALSAGPSRAVSSNAGRWRGRSNSARSLQALGATLPYSRVQPGGRPVRRKRSSRSARARRATRRTPRFRRTP